MRRKILRVAIRLIGPLLLVLVVWRIPDRGAILRALAAASAWPLVIAVLLNAANIHLKVLRWDVLLRTQGIRYPIGRAWASFLSSLYIGMLTPGRVGDVLRVQYLRHDLGVPYSEGLASVVMDRVCDLYVLLAFVAVGVVRFSSVLAGELAIVTWLGVGLTAAGPLVLLVPGVAERLMKRLYERFSRDPDAKGLDRFLGALRSHVGRGLFWTIPLTVLTFVVNYAQGVLIARSLGLSISLFDVTCLLAIASLLGLLPVSISGVGVRELFFALAFPVLGYAAEAGVTFGLLVFVVIYLAIAAVGFVGWQLSPPPSGLVSEAAAYGAGSGRRLSSDRPE